MSRYAKPKAGSLEPIFGRNLRAVRVYRGLTQGDLTDLMRERGGYDWRTENVVGRVERGTRRLGLTEAADLARCLGVSVDRLLQEEP